MSTEKQKDKIKLLEIKFNALVETMQGIAKLIDKNTKQIELMRTEINDMRKRELIIPVGEKKQQDPNARIELLHKGS